MKLGRAGVWLGSMANLPATDLRRAVAEIEQMGFGTIWLGEAVAREAFAGAAIILAATSRVVVATGIANIWVRDATAMMNGARALAEAWPDRFVLGIGVSHAPLVSGRGHQYERPLSAMRAYLDAMAKAPYRAAMPDRPPPIVLAALGPKMLELAREREVFCLMDQDAGRERDVAETRMAPRRPHRRPTGDQARHPVAGLGTLRERPAHGTCRPI